MKKMTFAFACASAVAAFAAAQNPVISSVDFEAYGDGSVQDVTLPFTGLSLKGDDGSAGAVTASRWLYDGAAGATDGSTVKAYDPEITGNANYLELSTEGGTLWRSINTLADSETLGAAQEISAETGLYVDTMVQFTPTEDGGAPSLGDDDKLAVWLDVKDNVTNLCVLGSFVYNEGADATQAVFRATNKVIDSSTWYRLTVAAIPAVDGGQLVADGLPGFKISIDGTELEFDQETMDSGSKEWLSAADKAVIASKTVIASAQGLNATATLQAVGFKGSGAIDSLQFTTEDPNADPAGEFTVDWGSEGVQAVWGDTAPTTAELAAIKAWAVANNLSADDVAGEKGAAAYLLGLTAVPEEMPVLKITAIEQTETGWTITIACDAQSDLTKINGSLVVKTAAELGGTWTSTVVTTPAATVAVTADGAKFMKAAIGKPVPPVTED